MASMRDVADKAGVSVSTVSVVLNNKKKVSEELRQRIFQAMDDLDYKLPTNVRARRSSKTIAIIIPFVSSLFFTHLLAGVTDVARSRGFDIIIKISGYDFKEEKTMVESILRENIVGLIIDSVCPIDLAEEYFGQMERIFKRTGVPVVYVERNLSQYNFKSIYVDNVKSAYTITRHLLEAGHRQIAHITGNLSSPQTIERIEGYRQALSEFGIEPNDDLIVVGDYSPITGYIRTKELISNNLKMTAIFGANDQTAIGAMKAIKAAGYSIPDDIAVVGFDNLSITTMIEPSLTTMSVPAYQMGREAVLAIAQRDFQRDSIELPCKLLVRRSSSNTSATEWDITGW